MLAVTWRVIFAGRLLLHLCPAAHGFNRFAHGASVNHRDNRHNCHAPTVDEDRQNEKHGYWLRWTGCLPACNMGCRQRVQLRKCTADYCSSRDSWVIPLHGCYTYVDDSGRDKLCRGQEWNPLRRYFVFGGFVFNKIRLRFRRVGCTVNARCDGVCC